MKIKTKYGTHKSYYMHLGIMPKSSSTYLRMPGPSERRDDLTGDGLLASEADSLLRRPHPLLVHVLAQVTQHHVQVRAHRLVLLLL